MRAARLVVAVASGVLFGFGLALSTMVSPEVVLSFLRWEDLGLMLVMGGAVAVTLVAYQLLPRLFRRPPWGQSWSVRASAMDRDTILGAAIFGAGWGLCGVCPGPAIAGLGTGSWSIGVALLGMVAGSYVQGLVADRRPRG